MNTSEVLYKAADEIDRRGWATGNCGMAVEGPTCLEGAIAAALGTETDVCGWSKGSPNDLDRGQVYYAYSDELQNSAAYRAASTYLERQGPSLFSWNDRQPSGDVVIEVLRAAAVIEEAKENPTAANSPAAHAATASEAVTGR